MHAGTGIIVAGALLVAPAPAVDTKLCGFPLQVTVEPSQPRHPQAAALQYTFGGPARITLRNVATGKTATLASATQSIDTRTGSVSFASPQTWWWSSGANVPFATTDAGRLRAPRYVLVGAGHTRAVDPCALVGSPPPSLRRTPAPWPPPSHTLSLVARAGLVPVIGAVIRHEHVQLDVTVNGKQVTVPAGIGLAEPEPTGHGVFARVANSPLHTHNSDGLIHIESDRLRTFTLGQFFDVWNVRFDSRCLGAYCTGGGKTLRVFLDGTRVASPRGIVLRDHERIAIVYR